MGGQAPPQDIVCWPLPLAPLPQPGHHNTNVEHLFDPHRAQPRKDRGPYLGFRRNGEIAHYVGFKEATGETPQQKAVGAVGHKSSPKVPDHRTKAPMHSSAPAVASGQPLVSARMHVATHRPTPTSKKQPIASLLALLRSSWRRPTTRWCSRHLPDSRESPPTKQMYATISTRANGSPTTGGDTKMASAQFHEGKRHMGTDTSKSPTNATSSDAASQP